MKVFKLKYKHLLLLLIILFAAYLRLYKLPEMASFDFDQESGSNIAYEIIKENHIRLIGQELTVGGIFMGPWYYYLLVPFYLASNLHPIGGAIASVVFSLVIIFFYYKTAEKMFGVSAGFIAAFIILLIIYDITALANSLLLTFSPAHVTIIAVIANRLLILIGNMGA